MSPEQPIFEVLSSTERLVLASKVNRLCDIEIGDNFDMGVLLDDAQTIVNTLDPALKVSGEWYIKGSLRGKSRSLGGLASTDKGFFQTNLEDRGKSKDIQLGQVFEDRTGLYKVTKTNEDCGLALNFAYFMKQISRDENIVGIGPTTHILYDKNDNLIKAIIKSEPVLFKLLRFKIIWFKQSNLWGKAKLNSVALHFVF